MLSSNHRLLKQKDFDYVHKKGRQIRGPMFNLKYVQSSLKVSRFGVVVGRKSEKLATKRNTVKRKVREIIRNLIDSVKPGFDVVVFIKKQAVDKDSKELKKELEQMLKKVELLNF